MTVEPLILTRYFSSRGIFTLTPASDPERDASATTVDLLALDAGRRTVHFTKIVSNAELAGLQEALQAEIDNWVTSHLQELQATGFITGDWRAHLLFLTPTDKIRELQVHLRFADGLARPISVVPMEDFLFPDRWPHVDSALQTAIESRPGDAEKPVISAEVAAEQLREAWIERRSEPTCQATRPFSRAESDDLENLLEGLRIKAEASALAAERERALLDGRDFDTEIAPRLFPVINRAKALPNCYLWMLHPKKAPSAAPEVFETLQHCYTNTAEALELAIAVEADSNIPGETRKQSLELLAEAQSALRSQAATLGISNDGEQVVVFAWLRNITKQRKIYVSRYMRKGDPADPSRWQDLQARIGELQLQLGDSSDLERRRRKLRGKIRHKISLLQNAQATDSDVRTLMSAVGALLDTGIAPSDPELRELLLPHLDEFPERAQCPDGFQRVLQEIDRFLAEQVQLEEQRREVRATPAESEAVRAVAGILRDQSILLIGGCCRPYSKEALEAAFGLRELIWLETSEHSSVSGFEPYVSRPDVALVLLAIRWSSHSFGEVAKYCERYGKPLVRLPSGYNPNQVAEQILRQQGDRLGIPADPTGGASTLPRTAGADSG